MDAYEFYTHLIRLTAIIVSAQQSDATIAKHPAFGRLLRDYVPDKLHEEFSKLFVDMLHEYYAAGKLKKISSNSVKIISCCENIKNQFSKKQRIMLLLQLLQIFESKTFYSKETDDYMELAADSMEIDSSLFYLMRLITRNRFTEAGSEYAIEVSKGMWCCKLRHEELMVVKCVRGKHYLNDRLMNNDSVFELQRGMKIVSEHGKQWHYYEIRKLFVTQHSETSCLQVSEISVTIGNRIILHPLSFNLNKGSLCAIAGRSGSGKSTLLQVLAGNIKVDSGHIVYNNYDQAHGTAGFVEQQEHFIPEFTVYQLMHDRSRILQATQKDFEIDKSDIDRILKTTGLFEQRNQRAGDANKSQLSGGQRKRLAIALELLRNQSLMLIDEPTSGLSSGDAREIMSLLRQIADNGKTIIVSLHQPEFDVLHLSDHLLILDSGGYQVYFGKTIDAAGYFRNTAQITDARAVACSHCYRYQPGDLFDIIEGNSFDEKGEIITKRNINPEQWYNSYRQSQYHTNQTVETEDWKSNITESKTKHNATKTFWHFVKRDTHRQLLKPAGLLILFSLTLLMALLIGYICRGNLTPYSFGNNPLAIAAIFMMIIAALFSGSMMAGHEICNDQLFRKSERRIVTHNFTWTVSKVFRTGILSLLISAIFTSVVFGMIEFKTGLFHYIILFALVFLHGALLALMLSTLFRKLSMVYLVIPILLIPQLLLSGLIIDFDNFPRALQHPKHTPFVADMAASRWAFEAIMVDAFMNNPYERHFYQTHYQKYLSSYYVDYFLVKSDELLKSDHHHALRIIEAEKDKHPIFELQSKNTELEIELIKSYFVAKRNTTLQLEEQIYNQLQQVYDISALRQNHHNSSIESLVLGRNIREPMVVHENAIERKFAPVFHLPVNSWGRSHLFAPAKKLGHAYIDCFWFNTLAIALLNLILIIIIIAAAGVLRS